MLIRVLLAGACLLAASGCASERLVGRSDLQIVSSTSLPPPGREDLIEEQRSYLIGPFDRVQIDVYGVTDLSKTVQVDASGNIALPLLGEVRASGRTTSELARSIEASLARYVRQPSVTVSADTVNQMITVSGEVSKPGQFPVTGRLTLMRALARAEGTTEFANSNFVVVYRTVNRQQMAALYDLRAIRQGIYADPDVYANDLIYVGESGSRRLFQSVTQSSGILTAPLIALLRL